MSEETDLTTKSIRELRELLEGCLARAESLAHAASEKLKQSELAGWDDDLQQDAANLMAEGEKASEEGDAVAKELERRYGLEPHDLEPLRRASILTRLDQRWSRRDLTTRTVPPSHDIDDLLPAALENILSLVPSGWWRHQLSLVTAEQREAVLEPLMLCGRERWPMGLPALHKFANYLVVSNDHMEKEPFLDTYTAARAIPQICSLGHSLETLKEVAGADSKLRQLCRAPSAETDSRIFELLVAAAFARMGHDVGFIEETGQKKTPDLRLHDSPIPMVVECKRKQPLSAYEQKEYAVMREVFGHLCGERMELGLVGELTIEFKQEIINTPVESVIGGVRAMTGSLSPYGANETEWGTLRLKPVPVSQELERTRLYSPTFLGTVFGIDLESDEFDGICAVAGNDRYPEVERAELPFLLKWTSNSPVALERKLQTVRALWIEAVDQIPTGETGLVYLAYEEGHRPSLADARTDALRELASTIYFKRRAIAVPMTVISRLYPNVLSEGRPDFIESTIPMAEGEWDNFDFWTREMPTSIYTW